MLLLVVARLGSTLSSSAACARASSSLPSSVRRRQPHTAKAILRRSKDELAQRANRHSRPTFTTKSAHSVTAPYVRFQTITDDSTGIGRSCPARRPIPLRGTRQRGYP